MYGVSDQIERCISIATDLQTTLISAVTCRVLHWLDSFARAAETFEAQSQHTLPPMAWR